jgi:hypothetical protein
MATGSTCGSCSAVYLTFLRCVKVEHICSPLSLVSSGACETLELGVSCGDVAVPTGVLTCLLCCMHACRLFARV